MNLWHILVSIFVSILSLLSAKSLKSYDLGNIEHLNETNRKHYWGDWNPSSQFCYTRQCTQIGREFYALINHTVNPCHDFYEFVCGKYSRDTEIPDDVVSVGTFQKADQNIQQILRSQLSQPNCKCDPFSVKYATDMYNGCLDSNTTESRGVRPLLDALKLFGGWPLIKNILPFNETNYNWLDALARFTAMYAESGIIDISISPDLKNTSQNILYLGPASGLHLGATLLDDIQNRSRGIPVPTSPPIMSEKLKRKQNYKKETLVEFLIKHILQMVVILGGESNNEVIQQIVDILVFSSRLTQIQTQGLDLNSQYNKMTFKQFEELSSGKINWLKFLNRVYELSGSRHRITPNDYCIVTDINYFKKLPDVLLNVTGTIFANFLGQIFVNDFGIYTVEEFRKLNFELLRVFYNVEKQELQWQFCVSLVRNTMGFAISRKYIEQNFLGQAKFMVTELVQYIRDSFSQLIEKNTILDDYSRRRALSKLKAIKDNVGYPNWLFDNRTLDSLYVLEKSCKRGMLFECVTYLLGRFEFKMLDSLGDPVNREISSFPFDPTTINAAYYPIQNSITIPAGIINALFGCENPRQLNYAQLGVIIGHELTHGFDTFGNQFDERGNLNEIFSNQTQLKFDETEKCFIDQYSGCCNGSRCVNGKVTVGENTADNGGMRETYKAYQMCNHNNGEAKRLPYVGYFTPTQLFFISYATLWCEKVRPEYLPVIYNDVHSPSKCRVNEVLANFKPFADAFKCANNSTMNPKDKCILW